MPDNQFIVRPTLEDRVRGKKLFEIAVRIHNARAEHAQKEAAEAAAKPQPPPEPKGIGRKLRDIAVEGAAHTLPGQVAQLVSGVKLTPETMGTEDLGWFGRGTAGLLGFGADPVTWGSLGVGKMAGGAAMRGAGALLGEKGIQKVAESGVKRLALKGATAAPAGAATLGSIETVKNPFTQLLETGRYSPKEHGKAISKGALIGGAAAAAGATPFVGLPAEIATFATGYPLLEGRMPTQEDWLNAAITIGGLRAAGIVKRGLADVAAKTPPKNVAKNILRELDPREGTFVFREAQRSRMHRENEKYTPPPGTNGRFEAVPLTITPDGKPAAGTKWQVRDKDTDTTGREEYGSLVSAARIADRANFRFADQPGLTQKSPMGVSPEAAKPATLTEPPVKTPETALESTQAVPGPIAQPGAVEARGASGIKPKPADMLSAESQLAPELTKPKRGTKKDAASEVRRLYERHREVIDGEEPGLADRAVAEEANVETALRPGYAFKEGYEAQAKEVMERLPANLRKSIRIVKKGSPSYQAADGQDVFAGIGTDKMAESVIRYAEQRPGRKGEAALDRTVEFAKANQEMFTPEEHLAIKNYEQARVGEGVEAVKAEQLKVGDEFDIQGKPHRVAGVEEGGRVRIEDDVPIDVPPRGKVLTDKGTLRQPEPDTSFEFGETIDVQTSEATARPLEGVAQAEPAGRVVRREVGAADAGTPRDVPRPQPKETRQPKQIIEDAVAENLATAKGGPGTVEFTDGTRTLRLKDKDVAEVKNGKEIGGWKFGSRDEAIRSISGQGSKAKAAIGGVRMRVRPSEVGARMEKRTGDVGVPPKTEKGLLGQDIDVTRRGAAGKQETLSPKIDEQIADNKAGAKQRAVDKEIGQQPLFGDQAGIAAGLIPKLPPMLETTQALGRQLERGVYRLAKTSGLDKVFKLRTPEEKQQARRENEQRRRMTLREHGKKAAASMRIRAHLKEFDRLAGIENSLERYRIHQAIVGKYPMDRLPEAQRDWAERARDLQDEASTEFLEEVVRHFGADSQIARSVTQNLGTYLHEVFEPTLGDKLVAYLPGKLRLKAEQFQRKRDKWRVYVGNKPIVVANQQEAKALRDGLLSLREQTEPLNPFRAEFESRGEWIREKLEEAGITAYEVKRALVPKMAKPTAKPFRRSASEVRKEQQGGLFGRSGTNPPSSERPTYPNIRIEKPLTEKERLDMGFSRDPRYTWAISDMKTEHNTSMLRLSRKLSKLAHEPPALVAGNAKAEETWAASEGLAKVTASEKLVGMLHGKYLPKSWAKDINEAEAVAKGFSKMWQDYLTTWKVAKVLYNPATHRRNITGNIGFAFMAGLSPWNPANAPFLRKAITDLKTRGPMYRLLRDMGVIGGEWFGNEVYDKGYEFISGTPDSPMKAVWGMMNAVHEKAGHVYNLEDQIWKVWHAYKLQSKGMKGARLAREVDLHWPNYAGLPRWVKKVSRHFAGTPFVAFNAEAVRIYKNAALRHPGRLLIWNLWPTAMTKLAKWQLATMGASDDELEAIDENRKVIGIPGTDIELDLQPILPPIPFMPEDTAKWVEEKIGWNPRTGRDSRGAIRTVDVTFDLPLGNEILEVFEGRPPIFMQPGVVTLNDLFRRRPTDRYTGKPIFDDDDTPEVKWEKGWAHFWQETLPLPAWAPTQHGWGKVKNAIQGTEDVSVHGAVAHALLGFNFKRPFVTREEAVRRLKARALLDDRVADLVERAIGEDLRKIPSKRLVRLLERNPEVMTFIDTYNEAYRFLGGPTSRVSDPITTQTIASSLKGNVGRVMLFELRLSELMKKDVSNELLPGEKGELESIRDHERQILDMMERMQAAQTNEAKAELLAQFDALLRKARVQMPETRHPERSLKRLRRSGENPLRNAG